MIRNFKISSLMLIASCMLCSCGIKTTYTDQLKLTADFEGEVFTAPNDGNNAIGEVTITRVTDGDTFSFINGKDANVLEEVSMALRFIGANTPESTARVEPWGVKASQFTKSILWDEESESQKPYNVVLQNDYAAFNQQDANGRYLGFVWYQMNKGDDFRLLNLELVEQCYASSTLADYSAFCPYLDYFEKAYSIARESGKRIYGEVDDSYDYTNTILEGISIKNLRENYENYGVSDEDPSATSSGLRLRITGVIIEFAGANLLLQDVVDPYPNGEYASIYVFTSISCPGVNKTYDVGDIITFTCRATTYSNNIQLTDVQDNSALGEKYAINTLLDLDDYGYDDTQAFWRNGKYDELKEAAKQIGLNSSFEEEFAYNVFPYIKDFSNFSNTMLEDYVGRYVQIQLTVREADEDDPVGSSGSSNGTYYQIDSSDNETIYAEINENVKTNIRISAFAGRYSNSDFEVGKTYNIIGLLAKYYDSYQLQIPNRTKKSPAFSSYLDSNGEVLEREIKGYKWDIV